MGRWEEYNLRRSVRCVAIAHGDTRKVTHKERYWNGMIVDSGHVRTDDETVDMINFSHDLCKGKLNVDSGATRSVAGLRVFEDCHQYYHQNLRNADSVFQPTDEAPLMLTFAHLCCWVWTSCVILNWVSFLPQESHILVG